MKSKIKLKGKYKFILTFNVPLQGTIKLTTKTQKNKITTEGNNFIIRRLYSPVLDPINYIAIAKTTNLETLKGEGIVKKIEKTTPKSSSVEFSTSFTSNEIEGIQQIGLTNKEKNGQIITQSTLDEAFTKLPEGFTIQLQYTLTLGED